MGECVRCHYSLHGLPDTHLFPECGLAYDPDMQVIRLEARSFARNQLFYEVLLIALFFSSWRNLEPGERLQTAIFCGLVGILAVVIWARGPSSSTAQAMFLTHRGIVLDFFGDSDEVIDWAAFHHASYKWLGGRVVWVDTEGRASSVAVCGSSAARAWHASVLEN